MTKNIGVIIVEKSGTLKNLTIKEFKEEELYKKCNFKKSEGFIVQTQWNIRLNSQKYTISLYAKEDGKAGTENKYDFPPPVDNKLFCGACILVGYLRDDNNSKTLFSLTIPLWTAIYEKLFGGFEDLNDKKLEEEDDEEEDELDDISNSKKTKTGYLKDGFITDDDNNSSDEYTSDTSDTETSNDRDELTEQEDSEEIVEDIGSELSEESYDYSDDE